MLKERLANLLKVKTIITIMLSIVFCYLAVVGVIAAELFMSVFTVIIAFYFGTQAQKRADAAGAELTE
jgi:5-bromo-4-chloroindolyl phosphate hydrolysis protein